MNSYRNGQEGVWLVNKFVLVSCIKLDNGEEVGHDGPVVVLANTMDPSFALFFPVSKENASIINYVLENEGEYDIDTDILGVYKTMINSWRAGDRFLSGLIMDSVYDEEKEEDVMMIRLALVDNRNGTLDSLVHVNFVHGMLLAAMEKTEIIIGEKILEKLMPEIDDDDDEDEDETEGVSIKKKINKKKVKKHDFPEDKNLLEIVKKIMNSNIKKD